MDALSLKKLKPVKKYFQTNYYLSQIDWKWSFHEIREKCLLIEPANLIRLGQERIATKTCPFWLWLFLVRVHFKVPINFCLDGDIACRNI